MGVREKLNESPINYFSDLFVAAMVLLWIAATVVMTAAAIWATAAIGDTSIWCEVGTLVAAPVTCGAGIWMVKNSVQHAIANARGERAHMDFPAVEEAEFCGHERAVGEEDTEEDTDDDTEDDTEEVGENG